MNQTILINNREIALTNLDKVLYPNDLITKQDLITYYQKIAPYILPYLNQRALSLMRFPDGIDGKRFFQKNRPDYFPTWLKSVAVSLKSIDQTDHYLYCNNLETLIYLANDVCVPHAWLSYIDKLDYPNKIIFDLDPFKISDFNQVRLLALELQAILAQLGLTAFAMLTGSTGLHVVVPIKRNKPFNEVRLFAKNVAQVLVKKNPDKYTLEARVEKRQARVYIDILRNSFGATTVVPYALRDKPGAPIAMPISWHEMQDSKLFSQKYQLKNVFTHLAQTQDPWGDFELKAVTLTEPLKKFKKLFL